MVSFNCRSAPTSYGPTISEFRQVPVSSVPETTYFFVSLKNGAPGSSSTVRADHAGSNISNVVRPSRMASHVSVSRPSASPIRGWNPYSDVHVGASTTPSSDMNSCTLIDLILGGQFKSGAVSTSRRNVWVTFQTATLEESRWRVDAEIMPGD